MLGRRFARCLADMYTRKYALSTTGWEILAIIGRHAPIYPNVIADMTTMESDRVSRAVDMLVRKGVVQRTGDDTDRRRVILRLTAKGKEIHADIDNTRRRLDAHMLSALGDDEQAQLLRLLTKIEDYVKGTYIGRDAWKEILCDCPPQAPCLQDQQDDIRL